MSGNEAELTQCLRDVLGLLALPAIWRGHRAADILLTFGEALEATLDVQVLLAVAKAADEPACVCRIGGENVATEDVRSWFAPFHGRSSVVQRVACGELGELIAVAEPLGYGGTDGYVVVASGRPGFPTPRELVAIKTASSLVTTALETAQAFREREAALRAKDDFLAMLGHELRNPLAPIATALDVMQLRNGGADSHEEQVMRRQIEYLRRLVDDLMDISKISRDALILERGSHELSEIVADAIEATAAIYQTNQHELTVRVPSRGLLIDGDRVRLVQVIGNLLINAAKYTPKGGHMHLDGQVDGSSIRLSLRDDGIGIAPELLPHIFEKFVQGQRHANRQHGGLGVGLSLVRTLIEMHGGRVSAHSDGLGQGSTFELQLPLSIGPARHVVDESRSEPPPSQVARRTTRVLIVDDNVDAAEMLAEALTLAGYDPHVEHSSTSAVARLERLAPDIALLDIGMPDLDGYGLCAQIRAQTSTRELPLIALTGYGQPADRTRAVDAGFSAHCTKPVRLSSLLDLIESLVSTARRAKIDHPASSRRE